MLMKKNAFSVKENYGIQHILSPLCIYKVFVGYAF